MKITETLRREIVTAGQGLEEAPLPEPASRTYQTGKDVAPKVTIRIEYPEGADISHYHLRAINFIREIEDKDQIQMPLEMAPEENSRKFRDI